MTPTTNPTDLVPVVSIVAICYNQEQFIREALDGFLDQQLDVPFEIVVADDASTDATPTIVAEYARRHPDVFRPILRTENVGAQANMVGALQASRGRYVALCEGDDYWTDVTKLARQVALLEQRPEVALCFHRVLVSRPDQPDAVFPTREAGRDASLATLLRENFIQTNSVVYRRLPDYGDVPLDILPLDWYLHVLHALTGSIVMLPEVMSVYRRHHGGLWWGSDSAGGSFWTTHGPAITRMCDATLALLEDRPDLDTDADAMAEQSLLVGTQLRLAAPRGGPSVPDLVRDSPRWAGRWIEELERNRRELHDRFEAQSDVATDRLHEITRLSDDVTRLNDDLRATQEVVAVMQARLEASEHDLSHRRERFAEQRQELTAARRTIRRQAQRIDRLLGQVVGLRSELERGVTRQSARRSFGRGVRVLKRASARRRGVTSS